MITFIKIKFKKIGSESHLRKTLISNFESLTIFHWSIRKEIGLLWFTEPFKVHYNIKFGIPIKSKSKKTHH